MSRYAIVENNICINIIEAEREFAKEFGAVSIPDEFGIGDSYKNGTWSKCKTDDPDPFSEIEQVKADIIILMEAIAEIYESVVI